LVRFAKKRKIQSGSNPVRLRCEFEGRQFRLHGAKPTREAARDFIRVIQRHSYSCDGPSWMTLPFRRLVQRNFDTSGVSAPSSDQGYRQAATLIDME
jgi:hypothetical protein